MSGRKAYTREAAAGSGNTRRLYPAGRSADLSSGVSTPRLSISASPLYISSAFSMGEKIYCISAAGSRSQSPFYGISEIPGCHRSFIGREDSSPQMKGPYPVVPAHFIGLGRPVLYFTVLIKSEQFIHCGRGIGKPAQGNGACRVQGSRITADGNGDLFLTVSTFAAVLQAARKQPRRQPRGQKLTPPTAGTGFFLLLSCSPSYIHIVSPFQDSHILLYLRRHFIAFCPSAAVFFRVEEAFNRPLPERITVLCFLPAAVHSIGTVFLQRNSPCVLCRLCPAVPYSSPGTEFPFSALPAEDPGRHGQEKLLRIGMPGIGTDRSGFSRLHQFPPEEDAYSAANPGNRFHIMGDKQTGQSLLCLKLPEQFQQSVPGGSVQGRKGLVTDQKLQAADQSPGNAGSLPFSPDNSRGYRFLTVSLRPESRSVSAAFCLRIRESGTLFRIASSRACPTVRQGFRAP